MKIVSLGLILTAMFLIVGCSDDDESSNPTGPYRYTAFLNNVPVVEGTIQIDSLNTQNVSGHWTFMLLVKNAMMLDRKSAAVILPALSMERLLA